MCVISAPVFGIISQFTPFAKLDDSLEGRGVQLHILKNVVYVLVVQDDVKVHSTQTSIIYSRPVP